MALMSLTPFRSMSRWPDFWDDEDFMSMTTTGTDNLDVYETEDEVVVKANVAGVQAEDIEVTFEKGVLRIRAEAMDEGEEDKQHYSKSSWSYSYRVAVPGMSQGMIDQNAEPKAEIDNGVITISFKKAEASKPKRLKVTTK